MSIQGKWGTLSWLALAELFAMTLWFSASAVVPQLTTEWDLEGTGRAWLTMSVQIGFVAGALVSALLNLSDRFDVRRVFVVCSVAAALINAAIPLLDAGLMPTLALRFLTGALLAGVYPTGMKIMATWCKEDRGFGIGLLVGALTLGSALPHLLNAVPLFGDAGMPPWRPVLLITSALALASAVIASLFVRTGPFLASRAPFDWHYALRIITDRPLRLANFGYLGHMWELYAMWAWAPIFLLESYARVGMSTSAARLAGFATIGAGALGSVLAGVLADRIGRTTIAIASLVISGCCALVVGLFFDVPVVATALCILWGFAVVADSAQFSTAISELSDPRYVGTALTIQTSLGFLLTLATIQLVPLLDDTLGWHYVFTILALGPLFGIISMLRLRALPEAANMASGRR